MREPVRALLEFLGHLPRTPQAHHQHEPARKSASSLPDARSSSLLSNTRRTLDRPRRWPKLPARVEGWHEGSPHRVFNESLIELLSISVNCRLFSALFSHHYRWPLVSVRNTFFTALAGADKVTFFRSANRLSRPSPLLPGVREPERKNLTFFLFLGVREECFSLRPQEGNGNVRMVHKKRSESRRQKLLAPLRLNSNKGAKTLTGLWFLHCWVFIRCWLSGQPPDRYTCRRHPVRDADRFPDSFCSHGRRSVGSLHPIGP